MVAAFADCMAAECFIAVAALVFPASPAPVATDL